MSERERESESMRGGGSGGAICNHVYDLLLEDKSGADLEKQAKPVVVHDAEHPLEALEHSDRSRHVVLLSRAVDASVGDRPGEDDAASEDPRRE